MLHRLCVTRCFLHAVTKPDHAALHVKKDRYPEVVECFIQTGDDRRKRHIAVMVTIVPADMPGVIEKDFTPATVDEQNEIKQVRGQSTGLSAKQKFAVVGQKE